MEQPRSFIIVHGTWAIDSFHLWAEATDQKANATIPAVAMLDSPREPIGMNELRALAGDLWDSLLIQGAADSSLTLRLPFSTGGPKTPKSGNEISRQESLRNGDLLRPVEIGTLRFAAPDAVDLLTAIPQSTNRDAVIGDSIRYWSKLAALVLELLAKQRFVPAVYRSADRYEGFWRPVTEDPQTTGRLRTLIAAMPPLCRCMEAELRPVQSSALVESFLLRCVDGLIRRTLQGDELAQSLLEDHEGDPPLPVLWLRSLVSVETTIRAQTGEGRRIAQASDEWIGRLELARRDHPFRLIFQLDSPDGENGRGADRVKGPWRLSVQVQFTDDPGVLMSAEGFADEGSSNRGVMVSVPVESTRIALHAELVKAAEHFPPLIACASPEGRYSMELTLEQAYRFLKDAVPLLDQAGFGFVLPKWWRHERPRLRMQMKVHGARESSTEGSSSLSLDALVSFDWRIAVDDEELTAEEVAQLAASKEPLVRLRGQWTELRPGELQSAVEYVRRHRGESIPLMEALRQFYAADENETGISIVGLHGSGWVGQLLNGSFQESYEDCSQPEGFHGELRAYQRRGMAWLRFLTRHRLGGCLADDMGLGKTIQLIALWLNERQEDPQIGPTLLIVPMSVVGNWRREIERFAPALRVLVHHGTERLSGREFVREVANHDVVISTYGLSHRDLDHLAAVDWFRVALDEAQNIKNPSAKQSLAIHLLRARHRVALTGTPVENRLSELWSILEFLNPGYLGSASDFRRRYAVPIERNRREDTALRLRNLIRPFVLRRLKSDPAIMPDLPEKMEMKVLCNLTKEQAGLYEAIVQEMMARIGSADGIQRRGLILATLVKLKQICNHPAHFLGDGSPLPRRSGKCDRLTEMLDEVVAEGDRALVFTQYKEMGDLLHRLVESSLGRPVLFLHGGTTQKGRDALVERFQTAGSDAPVFILSLKAGGLGLNLTAANHVFHFDRWWNPAVEDQASDRAHRIGQTRQVQVHKFVCIGTLEERIDQLIALKKDLAERIVGSGEDWLTELSTDALRELFALSKDAVSED